MTEGPSEGDRAASGRAPLEAIGGQPGPSRASRLGLGLGLLLFYLSSVLMHELVQQLLVKVFERIGFFVYELRFAIIWYFILVPCFAFVAVRLHRRHGRLALLGWLALVGLMAIVDHFFLFSQSEKIHYFQYAVIAMGLRALGFRRAAALLLAAGLGVLDESYQALVLYADRPDLPLDFKDMGLNLLGAALGLMLLATVQKGPLPLGQPRLNRAG